MRKTLFGLACLALVAGCTTIVPAEGPEARHGDEAAAPAARPGYAADGTLQPWVETSHGEIRRVSGAEGCVALTFDDGPHPTLTPRLLNLLAEENVHATFFLVGQRAQEWPDVVRAISAGGHEIGNHSWNHANLTQLENSAITRQLAMTDAAIFAIIGREPDIVRLPYDAGSPRVLSLIDRPVIFWDIDTLDWKAGSVGEIVDSAVRRAWSGSIVLMHDIHANTVSAVRGVIDGLRARGFEFVTVSELLSGRPCRVSTVVAAAGP
ncbi:MAG: polysaccharide deacetylase family protein [Bauldia sp.]|nr:polysaccharide deacetylase family protein [Bauldia sp.]